MPRRSRAALYRRDRPRAAPPGDVSAVDPEPIKRPPYLSGPDRGRPPIAMPCSSAAARRSPRQPSGPTLVALTQTARRRRQRCVRRAERVTSRGIDRGPPGASSPLLDATRPRAARILAAPRSCVVRAIDPFFEEFQIEVERSVSQPEICNSAFAEVAARFEKRSSPDPPAPRPFLRAALTGSALHAPASTVRAERGDGVDVVIAPRARRSRHSPTIEHRVSLGRTSSRDRAAASALEAPDRRPSHSTSTARHRRAERCARATDRRIAVPPRRVCAGG